jgi:hypothetical protein
MDRNTHARYCGQPGLQGDGRRAGGRITDAGNRPGFVVDHHHVADGDAVDHRIVDTIGRHHEYGRRAASGGDGGAQSNGCGNNRTGAVAVVGLTGDDAVDGIGVRPVAAGGDGVSECQRCVRTGIGDGVVARCVEGGDAGDQGHGDGHGGVDRLRARPVVKRKGGLVDDLGVGGQIGQGPADMHAKGKQKK